MAKIQIKSERDSLLLGDYFQSWSNLTLQRTKMFIIFLELNKINNFGCVTMHE